MPVYGIYTTEEKLETVIALIRRGMKDEQDKDAVKRLEMQLKGLEKDAKERLDAEETADEDDE